MRTSSSALDACMFLTAEALDSKASESRPVPMLAHGRLHELSAGNLLTRCGMASACSSGRAQSAESERSTGRQESVSLGRLRSEPTWENGSEHSGSLDC